MLTHPLAVPEKRFGLSLILAFFDRCAIRASLLPPPAALSADAHIAPQSLPCVSVFLKSGATKDLIVW